jgi:hypothetical protein
MGLMEQQVQQDLLAQQALRVEQDQPDLRVGLDPQVLPALVVQQDPQDRREAQGLPDLQEV